MIPYLIQVTLCLSIFYAFYHLALKRETLFHTNRIYLLTTMVLSMVLPLIKIYIDGLSASSDLIIAPYMYVDFYLYNMSDRVVMPEQKSFPWVKVIIGAYTIGVMIMSFRFLFAIKEILNIRLHGTHTSIYGRQCILSDSVQTPFSFFNTVYLPRLHTFEDEQLREVMSHELTHVREKHTWDILLTELICIAIWPSPLVYLYRKSLKEVHEYVADAAVIKDTPWENYAQLLLSQQRHHLQNILSHQLIYSQLKKRLLMMNKERSGGWARFKYLGIIPVLLFALVLFSFREKNITSTEGLANFAQSSFNINLDKTLEQLNLNMQKGVSGDTLPDTYMVALKTLNASSENLSSLPDVGSAEEMKRLGYERELPIFPGCENVPFADQGMCGMTKLGEYINSNMVYPESVRKAGIEGRVVVKFVVGADGYIKDVSIAESLHPDADKVVLELVQGMNAKAGKWMPTRKAGKSYDAEMQLPVKFALSDAVAKSEPIKMVDEMARFPGCEHIENAEERSTCAQSKMFDFIYSNLNYPKEDKDNKVEGTGIIQFVVGTDGSISEVNVVRSPSESIKAELMRVASAMAALPDKWIPAYKEGNPVAFQLNMPVKFKLQDDPSTSEVNVNKEVTRVSVVVTPNPANNTLSVNIHDNVQSIKIFDTSGRQVLSQNIRSGSTGKQNIDVSSLTPGQYVIQLISSSQTDSGSFTIQR